ncbi:MAG TPA: hypothetical protein VFK09_08370 [Gemmatimonadales bacterium]|nr:hypothetical protein [Gemmatimonadales bacterium]
MSGDDGGRASPRSRWIWPAAAFALAVAAYAQTFGYEFTFDDVGVIRNRELFHSLGRWREILLATWWPNALYRPFTALTLAANWTASGGDPRVFHVVNVLLHGATTVLVFLLARRLLPLPGAAAAAAVFAVHAVHVEAVANVVGRAEVLAALFALGAVLCYWQDHALASRGDDRSAGRWAATVGTLAFTLLALGSKESAFAVPALLLCVDWARSHDAGTRFGDEVRRHWLLWLAAVAVALGWLVWRAHMVRDLTGSENPPGLQGVGMPGRLAVMLPLAPHFLRLLFFPARLSADYSPYFVPASTRLTAGAIGGLALLLGAVALALAARRRAPAVTFALAWIGATVLIVSNVLVPTGVLIAERTLYLPSVGAALLAGWAFAAIQPRAPRAAAVALALAVGAAAWRTVTRNPVWRNNTALFESIVADAPGSFRSPWTRAMLLAERGDSAGAERELRRAISIYPTWPPVWRDLGRLQFLRRNHRAAAQSYWAAWRIDQAEPLDAERAIENDLLAGQADSAEARLAEARAAMPYAAELDVAASYLALARGEPRQAMGLRRQAALRSPDKPRYWALTIDAAVRAGSCDEAERALVRLKQLRPGYLDLPQLEEEARRAGCGA